MIIEQLIDEFITKYVFPSLESGDIPHFLMIGILLLAMMNTPLL